MISSVFIVYHGSPLLYRAYREECTRQDAVLFAKNVYNKSLGPYKPIWQFGFTTYVSVEMGSFYIVASCNGNINAALIIQALCDIRTAIVRFMDFNINETSILNNLFLIHEILDIAIDAGYPQDFFINYITGVPHRESSLSLCKKKLLHIRSYLEGYGVDVNHYLKSGVVRHSEEAATPTSSIEVSPKMKFWKTPKLLTRKNDVAFSVTECINCCLSYAGEVTLCQTTGSITMDVYTVDDMSMEITLNTDFIKLPSMNHCKKLEAINDLEFQPPAGAFISTTLTDFKVDKSIDISSMIRQKRISVSPSSGMTVLLLYRTENQTKLPFVITPILTKASSQVLYYHISMETNFPKKTFATNVGMDIPLPINASHVEIISNAGQCQIKIAENMVHWHLGKVYGQTILSMEFHCRLTKSITGVSTHLSPLALHFDLPNYSFSGLYIRDVKITNTQYKTIKSVSYTTVNGEYHYKLKLPT
ncbi:Adaptor complexes medium subunit family protein [Babesia bovis T2Bo]|uniref:Clathrin coat adaptor subunit, putative n=1 Tax=Babesia bovis TaxID=5865 RepID=A7AS46_BABBO|nr:Adaptor complexes medium subunit family protein [Babesia bovis T2Bo]EDO07365.1 Adaptor complexes medium subunit family protein [Babesia bovis T2Bo]|eukprot:XP_001610933.1 clathrin coat adaptor subunit [Babesia bovis T2Bo]